MILLFVFNYVIVGVLSFSAGVPPLRSVCMNMLPHHDTYKPQSTPAPFTITTSAESIPAGSDLTVYLNSTNPEILFKGFYVQARSESNKPIGTFTNNAVTKSHSCGGIKSNGAHHGNGKVEKSSAAMRWTAPKGYTGEVNFIGTFVQNYVTIWAGVYSDSVNILPSNQSASRNAIPGGSNPRRTGGGIIGGILDFISGIGNTITRGLAGLRNRNNPS